MRITLRAILPLLVLAVAPTAAEAQRGFPGGIRNSPQPIVDEAPAPAPGVALAVAAGPQLTWMLGTAGKTSGAGSSFSTLGGVNIDFASPLNLDATVFYQRAMPDDLDATNAYGGTVELGLSHEVTRDTLEFGISASGELGWEGESARSYAAGVSASATFLSRLELGGNLAYAGSNPGTGDTEWELVPGVSATVTPYKDLRLGINYTFENDLAVDDGYEVLVRYTVRRFPTRPFQLRVGMDSEERFGAGIILTF